MGAASYLKDEAEFEQQLGSQPAMVVDCTASWCGPCKLVAPLMDQLAEAYDGRVAVFKLDLDANKPVAKRFGIKSIPAVMYFKQGELKETLIGVKPYETFAGSVDALLAD